MAQLPGHIQARRRDGVPAWMTIKTAEYAVEVGLQFHYPSFTMSTSQARRLDVLIQTMLDEGKITKDPFREKQWLTCEIMKRMTAAVLANAIDHGTKCWDTTVANALSLVMQSALSSRSGDFKKSLLYADEFLKWEHIVLAALGDRANPKLTMVVTLNHCKGWK